MSNLRISLGWALLAAVFAAAGCTNPFADDEHEHVDGVEVVFQGETLATVLNDEVTGELVVQSGGSLGPLTIRYLGHDGEPIDFEPGYWVRPVVLDGDVASFVQPQEGDFSGTLHGLAAGTTGIRFELVHGAVGGGHLDYAPAPIPVRVSD